MGNNLAEPAESYKSKSVLTLVIWNVVIIIWALADKWNPFLLVLIYWSQSLIDVIFSAIRVLNSESVYLKNKKGILELLQNNEKYGYVLFHFGLVFGLPHILWPYGMLTCKDISRYFHLTQWILPLFVSSCLYIANNIYLLSSDKKREPKILYDKLLSFLGMYRIVPLWLTILIVALLHMADAPCILVPIMFVKTIVDIAGESAMNKAYLSKN